MIEDARGNIDYAEEGSGPTLVLVPGSWGTRSAWRSVIAAFGGGFRCVTTSLLGYGQTAERRSQVDVSISHEAEIIETVIQRTGGAVHLVGHSYGTQACLAVAVRSAAPLISLSVIEPTGTNLLRRAEELTLYEQVCALQNAYFRAFESGDKEAARRVIYGHGSFDALPSRVRDYIVAATATNILDWRSGAAMDEPLEAYSRIEIPTLIIRGGCGHAYVVRCAEILGTTMPHASLVAVPGAAHSMMATHGPQVAKLLSEHISKAHAAR